jgi:hypothetical protein
MSISGLGWRERYYLTPNDKLAYNRPRLSNLRVTTHPCVGMTQWCARGGKVVVGRVMGNTGDRADKLPVTVPKNAFVIRADVVSHLGEGIFVLPGET